MNYEVGVGNVVLRVVWYKYFEHNENMESVWRDLFLVDVIMFRFTNSKLVLPAVVQLTEMNKSLKEIHLVQKQN